jgi:uncharacterized protein (TIGR03435 family)
LLRKAGRSSNRRQKIAIRESSFVRDGLVKKLRRSFVAEHLSDRLRRVIVDRTGLDGNFDFNVELAVDRGEFTDPSVSELDNITRLFTDLVDKLGLKLESQKGLVEVLVVDHAERPDEN